MSKTYKHQMMWDMANYSDDRPNVFNGLVNFELPRDHENPYYKHYKYSRMWIEVGESKQEYKKQTHRKSRREVKRFLSNEMWEEAKYVKPEDISWMIW